MTFALAFALALALALAFAFAFPFAVGIEARHEEEYPVVVMMDEWAWTGLDEH